MTQHDPELCEKVPYTGYYSDGHWSSQFKCQKCGAVQRLNLTILGHGEKFCDGSGIGPAGADQALLIYQRAIDKSANAGDGAACWANMRPALEAVIAAPTTAAAAGVIT